MANPAADDSGLYEGCILGGKYRLEAEVGRGAMGTVWAAMHETLGQRVAVKIISQEHASSDELRKRFDKEARAAAKLRSRFVVGVYDNGVTDHGLPYIVMEYLEGECLEDRIARQGCISVADTARIARHVGRALSKAHAHGIVHRDLKPANIFITKSDDEDDGDDWTAKVLDFGIAKMDDFGDRSTTKTGTVLGTPLFMSPEQVRGASDVDSRADLYSMGMVIYNMLTGTYAFEGQSFGDLLVSICTDPLPELSRAAPTAPPALGAWFQKACARDPNARYQSADEMTSALTDAIGDTAPSMRLSLSDISSTEQLIPLAETYAASSEIAESGSREVGHLSTGDNTASLGTSSRSIVEAPSKKSWLPYVVAGVAVLAGATIALVLSESTAQVDAPQEEMGASTQTEASTAAPLDLDAEKPVELEEAKDPTNKELEGSETVKPSGTTPTKANSPSASTKLLQGAKPAPAPTVAPRPRVTPQPAPTTRPTSATQPAPVKQPAPAPSPKPNTSSLDLGF